MKKINLLLLIIPIISYSQYKITGKIVGKTTKPVEYAEIILQTSDAVAIESALTDKNGNFIIKNVNKGTYQLTIKYFSQNIHSQTINVKGDLNLNTITTDEGLSLKEVVITEKKPIIERKVDRLVFNVENSVATTGGNALDALKITPRIKIQNNKISMIGKGSIAVMIDDRIVQMSGEELSNYLESLSADDIKSIEVISNPPAKYSAEGNSGLINIVLKKSKKEAWNTSLRSFYQQATYPQNTFGGNFNLQKGKIQITSNINNVNGSKAVNRNSQIFYPNKDWDQITNEHHFYNYMRLKLQLEYKINEKLSTGVIYGFVDNELLIKEIDKTNLSAPSSGSLDSLITTLGRNEFDRRPNSLNYHFIYDIDTIGRKLSLDFDYFNYKNETNNIFNTQTFLPNNQPIASSLAKGRNYSDQDIQNYSVNIDMEHPSKLANFNYGSRIVFTEIYNLYDYFNIIDNSEIQNTNLSNEFDYKENTQAIYLSAQKSLSEKWETKVGLRYEFTQTKGFSKTLNQTNINDYLKLFPTAYITYNPNDTHSFSFNYGKRITRPSFWILNPFRWTLNLYTYVVGNPFLQPSFTDNIELEYAYKNKSITKFWFSYADDNFTQAPILNKDTKITKIIHLNYAVEKSLGVNQTFIFKPTKWWNINASADVYYSDVNSKVTVMLQYLSGWNGNFSVSNDFSLNTKKTILANVNYYYATDGVSSLYYASSRNQLNASIKWLLLDKKLTISLYANDILKGAIYTYTVYSNNIKSSFGNYYDARYFRIGIIYNFGKKFKTTNRKSKNQEEQNRTN